MDGGVFDSTIVREKEFYFIIGEGHVIPAWDIAIQTMQIGEKIELITPPVFAFGELGCPPRIPPGATLKYEITLLRFSLPIEKQSLTTVESVTDSIEIAKTLRCEGNAFVSSKSFRKATKAYNRALDIFKNLKNISDKDDVLINESKIPLYSNLAFCYLKLSDYKRAIESCFKVIL